MFSVPAFAQSDEAKAAAARGLQLRQQGQYAAAIAAYKEATVLDPEYANAWWGLGNSYYYSNQKQAALRAYDRYLALSPGDPARVQFVENLRKQLPAAPAAKPVVKPVVKPPAAKPVVKKAPAPAMDEGAEGEEMAGAEEQPGDGEFGASPAPTGEESPVEPAPAPRVQQPKPKPKPAPVVRQPEPEQPASARRRAETALARQPRPGGFLISFGFTSVPMKWKYAERTHRHTDLNTTDDIFAAKTEKFRMGVVTIRGAKMFEVLKNFSAGLEAGLAFPMSKRKFQFAAAQRVAGSRQDFVAPNDYSLGSAVGANTGGIAADNGNTTFGVDFSTFGATTLDVEMKAFYFPLMAKLQYSIPFGAGNFVDIGTAFGGFVYSARAIFTGAGFNADGTAAIVKKEFRQISVLPAAELNAGVSLRVHRNIDVIVNGIASYSAVAKLGHKAGGYEDSSALAKTSFDGTLTNLAYQNGMEVGGLGFGGNVGVNLHF